MVPGRPVSQQAIASAGGGLQHVPILAKRLADRRYVDLERVLSDHGARPDAVHEIVLGDQFVGRLNQDLDDFERTAADRHRDAARQ